MGTTDYRPCKLLLKNGANFHNIKRLHETLTILIDFWCSGFVQIIGPNCKRNDEV